MVFDYDHHFSGNHKKKTIEVIKELAPAEKFGVAVSNPSFEVWLYLHHEEISSKEKNNFANKQFLEEKLRNAIGEASKTPKQIHYTKEKLDNAKKRASVLQPDAKELFPINLGTHVYEIFIELSS